MRGRTLVGGTATRGFGLLGLYGHRSGKNQTEETDVRDESSWQSEVPVNDGAESETLPSSLTDAFVQRQCPCRPYPWKIRGYRSFRQSERETATYRLSMWLLTAGQWCW
jgi:hypothetical protein